MNPKTGSTLGVPKVRGTFKRGHRGYIGSHRVYIRFKVKGFPRIGSSFAGSPGYGL